MVNFSLVPRVIMRWSRTEPAEEESPLSRGEFSLVTILFPATALLTLSLFPSGPQPWRFAWLGRTPGWQLSRCFSSQQGWRWEWESPAMLTEGMNLETGGFAVFWQRLSPWPKSGQGPLSPVSLDLPCTSLSGLYSPILVKIPASRVSQRIPTPDIWPNSSSPTLLQGVSDYPSLPSARLSLGQCNQTNPTLFPILHPPTALWQ